MDILYCQNSLHLQLYDSERNGHLLHGLTIFFFLPPKPQSD